MFGYFTNYSSNAYQVCCEDSPTKGLYDNCQSDDLDLHSSACQTGLLFNLRYLGQYLNYHIQTCHDRRLMDAIYAHARFDDLDPDARSQWVGKGKKHSSMLSVTKRQTCHINIVIIISITTAGNCFYVTLPLQTFIWLDNLDLFCHTSTSTSTCKTQQSQLVFPRMMMK